MNAPEAIGGYFGLELQDGSDFHRGVQQFQSARAAFFAVLKSHRPSRVWLPWFICESMADVVRAVGIPTVRYAVDASFAPVHIPALAEDEWVVYVNYFGLQERQVDSVLQQHPGEQVVIDNAQAFYSRPRNNLATIYSPRKFFGVPDGGYLSAKCSVPDPHTTDQGTVARCSHLLIRAAQGAEAGYLDFVAAEQSLSDPEPRKISPLTARMLGAIDYSTVRSRRIQNFAQLHGALGATNVLHVEVPEGAAPLCYPYYSEELELRSRLLSKRIFTPTYWPEIAAGTTGAPEFERNLARFIVPLPCDQRYSGFEMNKIIEAVRSGVR